MRTRSLSLALLVLGLTLPAARAADKVTLDDLLKQMTDLSLLAEYPDPPYVTKQFSSYDRASEAPGKESWFANADRGFMLYDGVVKEKTPYFKTEPTREGPEDGSFAAGTKVGFSPTHKPVGKFVWAYATAADGRAIDGKIPQGYIDKDAVTPARPRPGGDGRPRLRGQHLVGRPRRRRQNPHLSGRGERPGDRGAAGRTAGRQVEDEDRRQGNDAIPRPDRLRTLARLQPVLSPSPTPSTARSRWTSRTFIITSITGRTRRGRRWRRSPSGNSPRSGTRLPALPTR